MAFHLIDMETWERRDHYRYYQTLVCTGYTLTTEADITRLLEEVRRRGEQYGPNKLSEGIVLALDGATAVNAIPRLLAAVMSALEEYRDVVKNRAAWRERINELEAELDRIESR